MRILHTSDWHLGRRFGDCSLLGEQERVADRLVEIVRSEGVELVAVAGDIFDRSVPPADAVTLWFDTVRRLCDAGAVVAAIAGNHDSADRLNATDGITDDHGLYLRGGYGPSAAVTELHLPSGSLALVTVPFLDPHAAPAEVRDRLAGPRAGDDRAPAPRSPLTRPSHEAVLADALGRARSALPAGVPSLALSHAFVTGAAPSDSERGLAVGDAGMVSASVYEGFDYVALGHLHRPQTVAGRDHIRYSGSPLPYSIGETRPKEVVLVELDARGLVAASPIPLGVGRGVRTVSGTMASLVAEPPDREHWVRVEITDSERPIDPARVLAPVFPHAVEFAWVGGRAAVGPAAEVPEITGRTPVDLAAAFWEFVTAEQPGDDVLAVIGEVLDDDEDAREEAA